jgi:hypothetical protein
MHSILVLIGLLFGAKRSPTQSVLCERELPGMMALGHDIELRVVNKAAGNYSCGELSKFFRNCSNGAKTDWPGLRQADFKIKYSFQFATPPSRLLAAHCATGVTCSKKYNHSGDYNVLISSLLAPNRLHRLVLRPGRGNVERAVHAVRSKRIFCQLHR